MKRLNKNYFLFFANFLLSNLLYLITLYDLERWNGGIRYYLCFSLFCALLNFINPHIIKAQYILAIALKVALLFLTLEITPTLVLFFVTLLAFDLILLNSLLHELKESLFYSPDLNLISSPLNNLDCSLMIEKNEFSVKLINFSENYIAILTTNILKKNETEGKDCHLKIGVSGSTFKIKIRPVFQKVNCNYFEIESNSSSRDGNWILCYTEMKKMKVLTRG
ncbi:MAG: hypothetical protein CME61_05950 [Halobacteriovoraceae bacterium]|nr:hypothetical protein [Halobacteriovoraceae bacterium]|tara:strand:+ start:65 stop:730 length:666 start_codon:yes stop_codon:yes gene_type:complete